MLNTPNPCANRVILQAPLKITLSKAFHLCGNASYLVSFFLTLGLLNSASAEQTNVVWPKKKFARELATSDQLSRCQSFVDRAVNRVPLIPNVPDSIAMTDQLLILKGGKVVYEWANAPYFTVDKKHRLWSASKTLSSVVMGAAIARGDLKTPSGRPLSLETPVSEFFSYESHISRGPAPLLEPKYPSNDRELYHRIKIKHLLDMSAGMNWVEDYTGDPVKSSFMPMYYTVGRDDILSYALRAPMELAPGLRFNYSGGNSVILFGILKQLFSSSPSNFLKELLFAPLDMSRALYNRDSNGNFAASSSAFLTPDDMLKIGFLFLQDGVWEGRRILPRGWVKEARSLPESLTSPQALTTYEDVKNEGVWSRLSWWLNQTVDLNWKDAQGKPLIWGPEMSHSPKDLFFAAGHFGQLILVIPSEDMVIARTGHDEKYWDNTSNPPINKIDPLVSGAVACFKSNTRAKSTSL